MRILVISHEYPPIGGGGANACLFLSKEFAQSGNQVTIVTAWFKGEKASETTRENVQIYRVKCKRKKKETSSFFEMFTYLLAAWKKADKLASTEHYDICLVFFGIPSGPIALYLRKKYKLPYILRLGGGDIPGAQKRFKYMYKILNPFIHNIWKNSARLVANSEGLKKRALNYENKYPIDIIENGVDTIFFSPNQKETREFIYILFVSRLIEGKGLQYIIPTLKDVNRDVIDKCGKSIQLVIVGDGPYRDQLETLVSQTDTSEIVKFEGRKPKEEIKYYYQNADLFILPSLSEGMPNVVLEAMACGLPILMTPCEGSDELIKDNGIISTLEEFPSNLVALCTDVKLRAEMGKNSLYRVESNFQWGSIAKRYMGLMLNQSNESIDGEKKSGDIR